MCNSKPNLWPRQKGTGADVAVDGLARIEAVHGLLTATYPRLLIAFARPSGQPQPREAPGTLSGAWHREEGGKGLEARGESEDMGPADQAEAAADTTLPEGGGCAAESEESRSAAQHAKERRAAARWLATEPFGYLIDAASEPHVVQPTGHLL